MNQVNPFSYHVGYHFAAMDLCKREHDLESYAHNKKLYEYYLKRQKLWDELSEICEKVGMK